MRGGGRWIVLEGNRALLRCSALRDQRAQFDKTERWDELTEGRPIGLDMQVVPVLIATER